MGAAIASQNLDALPTSPEHETASEHEHCVDIVSVDGHTTRSTRSSNTSLTLTAAEPNPSSACDIRLTLHGTWVCVLTKGQLILSN